MLEGTKKYNVHVTYQFKMACGFSIFTNSSSSSKYKGWGLPKGLNDDEGERPRV